MRTVQCLLAAAISLGLMSPLQSIADASFRIEIFDNPDFGFNDPTPVAPIGGNQATTLGEQRLNALREAVAIWAATIDSPIEIVILTKWWDGIGGPLASAEVAFWMRDFAGAPRANTWYPLALANKLAGVDFCPPPEGGDCGGDYDVFIDFFSEHRFYLGLDGNLPDDEFDLVSVSLHEIGHGLGITTRFTSPQMTQGPPESPRSSNAIYHYFLEHHFFDRTFPQMTFFERSVAAVGGRFLHWIGPRGMAAAESLTVGRDPSGHLLLFAGANNVSMIHLIHDVSPPNFMSVSLAGSPRDTTIAYSMLADLGWEEHCPGDCNADGRITISELLRAVRMALARESLVRCAMLNVDDDGVVRVTELIRAVNSSLNGCGGASVRLSAEDRAVSIEVVRRDPAQSTAVGQPVGEEFEAQLSGPAGGVLGREVGSGYAMRPYVDSHGRVWAGCGGGTDPSLD